MLYPLATNVFVYAQCPSVQWYLWRLWYLGRLFKKLKHLWCIHFIIEKLVNRLIHNPCGHRISLINDILGFVSAKQNLHHYCLLALPGNSPYPGDFPSHNGKMLCSYILCSNALLYAQSSSTTWERYSICGSVDWSICKNYKRRLRLSINVITSPNSLKFSRQETKRILNPWNKEPNIQLDRRIFTAMHNRNTLQIANKTAQKCQQDMVTSYLNELWRQTSSPRYCQLIVSPLITDVGKR